MDDDDNEGDLNSNHATNVQIRKRRKQSRRNSRTSVLIMPSCFATSCNHKSSKDGCVFFRFPQNPTHFKKWELLCRRADRDAPQDARLCDGHFVGKRKENGPTIFEWNKIKTFTFESPQIRKRWNVPFILILAFKCYFCFLNALLCLSIVPLLPSWILFERHLDLIFTSQSQSVLIEVWSHSESWRPLPCLKNCWKIVNIVILVCSC